MEGMDLDAGGVQQTSFSPDGLMICTAFEDGSIFFWSIDTFSLVWKITLSNLVERKPINSNILDATEFATSMKKSLKIPRNSFFSVSANGELFAYGGLSSTLYIWNLFEKRLVHEILIPSFHGSIISQIEFLGNTDVLYVSKEIC
jgi:WD40 repeat protein